MAELAEDDDEEEDDTFHNVTDEVELILMVYMVGMSGPELIE